ncbi:MAG: transposase, partial [Treponema sp.]|nr:transposase [Treponema sp.]
KKSLNKARYVCTHCGHTDHADIHAAKNIRDPYAGLSNRDRLACQLEKR